MNIFDTFIADALNESFDIIGETINYKSKTIPAIVGDIRVTETLLDGGILEKRGIKIIIKKDELMIPAIGEKLIYNGQAFRVLELSSDAVSYELTCDTDAI